MFFSQNLCTNLFILTIGVFSFFCWPRICFWVKGFIWPFTRRFDCKILFISRKKLSLRRKTQNKDPLHLSYAYLVFQKNFRTLKNWNFLKHYFFRHAYNSLPRISVWYTLIVAKPKQGRVAERFFIVASCVRIFIAQ